ncbi:MAG: hypothetical protein ACK5N8_05940 [Alphaproteobacteria bacterium]
MKTIIVLVLIFLGILMFFHLLKKEIYQREVLKKIADIRKNFTENSENYLLLKSSIIHNGKLNKKNGFELRSILIIEISYLKYLIDIVEKESRDIVDRKRFSYSRIGLTAKKLCDERLKNKIKIGFGYTPYYSNSHEYASSINDLIYEYNHLDYLSINSMKKGKLLYKLGFWN